MARIPVERDRKGSPWWLWLLGLALIGLLAWLLIGIFDPDEPAEIATDENIEEVDPLDPAVGVLIIDPAEIQNATGPDSLVGRQVQLDSMYVVSVPGDSVFVVERSPATGDSTAAGTNVPVVGRVLVLLEEDIPAPPDSVEGRVNVEPGQTVRIEGEVRALTDELRQGLNLPGVNFQEVAQNGLYVHARSVTVSERP